MAILLPKKTAHRKVRKGKNEGTASRCNTVAFGDDAVEVFKKVLPQVETIHVNDLKAAGGVDFVVCGRGVAPIQEIFSVAKQGGFDGWVCIEEAGFDGVEGIAEAVEFTREAWERA